MMNNVEIGDEVQFISIAYNGLRMRVSSVNCERIGVERIDQNERSWVAYVDISELEKT